MVVIFVSGQDTDRRNHKNEKLRKHEKDKKWREGVQYGRRRKDFETISGDKVRSFALFAPVLIIGSFFLAKSAR